MELAVSANAVRHMKLVTVHRPLWISSILCSSSLIKLKVFLNLSRVLYM